MWGPIPQWFRHMVKVWKVLCWCESGTRVMPYSTPRHVRSTMDVVVPTSHLLGWNVGWYLNAFGPGWYHCRFCIATRVVWLWECHSTFNMSPPVSLYYITCVALSAALLHFSMIFRYDFCWNTWERNMNKKYNIIRVFLLWCVQSYASILGYGGAWFRSGFDWHPDTFMSEVSPYYHHTH